MGEKRTKKENGEGYAVKLGTNSWQCTVQSKHMNPKSGKPKRIKRRGKTEREARSRAQDAMLAWEKSILYSATDLKTDKKKTFGQYFQEYVDNEAIKTISDSAYLSYCRCFNRYFHRYNIANEQLQNLNKLVFQLYYDDLAACYAHKTYVLCIQMCRRVCQDLVDRSLLKENYAQQAKEKKDIQDEYIKEVEKEVENIKEYFTEEDIMKFYEAWQRHYTEYAVVAVFLLEVALRPSEFAALTIDQIDFENKTLYVDHTRGYRYKDKNNHDLGTEEYEKVVKNKKKETIPLSDIAIECCEDMIYQTKLYCKNNPDNLLYPTFRTGKKRSNSTMENCFKDLCNKLEIDRGVHRRTSKDGNVDSKGNTVKGGVIGLSLYSLRHSMVTWANTSANANSTLTAMLARHSERIDKKVYTHRNVEAMRTVATPVSTLVRKNQEKEEEELTEEEERALLRKLMKKYKDEL